MAYLDCVIAVTQARPLHTAGRRSGPCLEGSELAPQSFNHIFVLCDCRRPGMPSTCSWHALYTRLVEDLAHALEAASWPPPLAPTPRSPDSAGMAGDADAERRASGEAASTAGPGGYLGMEWAGPKKAYL
eukprot:1138128-Pelagomonas_calceolata.AAC.4